MVLKVSQFILQINFLGGFHKLCYFKVGRGKFKLMLRTIYFSMEFVYSCILMEGNMINVYIVIYGCSLLGFSILLGLPDVSLLTCIIDHS